MSEQAVSRHSHTKLLTLNEGYFDVIMKGKLSKFIISSGCIPDCLFHLLRAAHFSYQVTEISISSVQSSELSEILSNKDNSGKECSVIHE